MPDLSFQVESAAADPYAASPLILFKLTISDAVVAEQVQNVALRCQIQIAASRRRYSAEEQQSLLDLFGEPDRWSQTLRSMLWTHAAVAVPSFVGSTVIDLPVSCTFDFNVAA